MAENKQNKGQWLLQHRIPEFMLCVCGVNSVFNLETKPCDNTKKREKPWDNAKYQIGTGGLTLTSRRLVQGPKKIIVIWGEQYE